MSAKPNANILEDKVEGGHKSKQHDVPAKVTFFNRTMRHVDVCWINYKGQLVLYHTLSSGGQYHLNTYVTHPWMFKDRETGDRLVANGQVIYYPTAWDGGTERTLVSIDIPVFALRNRCLQVLKPLVSKEEYEALEIPKSLKKDLSGKFNRPCPYVYPKYKH